MKKGNPTAPTVLVYDRYNGRDTVFCETQRDGSYTLHWLLIGNVEPIDVWLETRLTRPEVQMLFNVQGQTYEGLMASLTARAYHLIAHDMESHEVFSHGYTVGEPPGRTVGEAMYDLNERVRYASVASLSKDFKETLLHYLP